MGYTIEEFWTDKFRAAIPPTSTFSLPGWHIDSTLNPTFVEADLNLREDFGDLSKPVWFVAAPGAVGKSTLAKQISARTKVVYLDLAQAETVAGNYLTGGLVKNGLLESWQAGRTTVLIDALDEARLRVTKSSFEDFLSDVVTLSSPAHLLPTVIFGRVGIVEEAWLSLAERGLECPIFDIDYFDRSRAEKFVLTSMDRNCLDERYAAFAASFQSHRGVYQSAVTQLVHALENAAPSDGASFAGYAPVLEAVATVLSEITNPTTVNDAVHEAMKGQVLQHLTNEILVREGTKLRGQLPATMSSDVKDRLYLPDEQLSRLSARIYKVPVPDLKINLSQQDAGTYENAVRGFISQHPFLDGKTGFSPSGAVFGAAVNAHALRSKSTNLVRAAERYADHGQHTPNPFLVDFYLPPSSEADGMSEIPPEHLVALYESIRARAAAGEMVRLDIDADAEADTADAEITVISTASAKDVKRVKMATSQAGTLRFGRQVSGVSVNAPLMDVAIGSGGAAELVAPVFMNVAKITWNCPEISVQQGDKSSEDAAVVLEAKTIGESKLLGAPVVRKGTEFSVSWPDCNTYPWAQFAATSGSETSSAEHDSLRRLRRLILAFRSHSKGQLARFVDKIEHARMTQGEIGEAIRERLLRDGVLTTDGKMYYLDSTKLGEIVGVQFQDIKMNRFGERVHQYLSSIPSP